HKPDQLWQYICERAQQIDADKKEADLIMTQLRACLAVTDVNFESKRYWMPTPWIVLAVQHICHGMSPHQIELLLHRMEVKGQFEFHRKNTGRGYIYTGNNVDKSNLPPVLNVPYKPELKGLASTSGYPG